jgi:uncharacterized protein
MTLSIAEELADLLRPDAFPHPARDLRVVETHISWIVLAGDFAYKLRKPVNFGFLDFSTLEKRWLDCEAEVELNRRLCADLYIGVTGVVQRDGRLFMGGTGAWLEPAVAMRRLPESGMLPVVLERGLADDRLMERIARQLADFHAHAATGHGVDEYGSLATIRANWHENFDQATTVDSATRETIRAYVEQFVERNAPLLERRVRTGRVRDGHGDLHAGSVCATRRKLYLFDCIEFNARFRCADAAADVAFLAMDLDHLGRADLSTTFVDAYVRASGDQELTQLLDFYKCYRAFVRGKVLGFRAAQPGLQRADVEQIQQDARAYFDLAYTYATRGAPPMLLVVMGLPATGKTTLARALAGRFGLVHLSSDVARKNLGGLRPTAHRLDGYERGLYSRSMTRRTYAVLLRRAARALRRGQSVVMDATFGQLSDRAAVRQLARRTGARLHVVVCCTDDAVIRARLEARAFDTRSPSDARLEIWPSLRAAFAEPLEIADAIKVDTTRPVEHVLNEVVAAIRARTHGLAAYRAA